MKLSITFLILMVMLGFGIVPTMYYENKLLGWILAALTLVCYYIADKGLGEYKSTEEEEC